MGRERELGACSGSGETGPERVRGVGDIRRPGRCQPSVFGLMFIKPRTFNMCISCLHIMHQPKSIKTYPEKTSLSEKNLEIEVPFLALPFNMPPNHHDQKLNCLRFMC